MTRIDPAWNNESTRKRISDKARSHDDVIKWKHFPRYWPFVRGIHRSPVNSPHKGQWRGALVFSLIWAWINGWVNNREAGDLRRQRAHYDVIVTRWASEARLTSISTWWRHDMETLFTAGSLWEESHLWIPPTKDSVMRSFDVSLLLAWISSWTTGRVAGNLRPHNAHVMSLSWTLLMPQALQSRSQFTNTSVFHWLGPRSGCY